MTHTSTEQERAEVVAWRWRKPVVNDQGETIGDAAWELSDAPGFLPWWTNEPLIRLSDYQRLQADHERLQAECEKLRKQAEDGWEAARRCAPQWKVVPVEPTEKMISEGSCAQTLEHGHRYIGECAAKTAWSFMLAVAPQPPEGLMTTKPEAAPVQLPEPFTTLVRKKSWPTNCYEAAPLANHRDYGRQWADERVEVYTEQQVRDLLAEVSAPAARYQALVESGNFAPSPFDNGMWGLRTSSSPSTKAELDAAVDRVIAAQAKQGGEENG